MNVNVMSVGEGEGEGKEVKLVGTTAAAFVGIRSNGILLQVQILGSFYCSRNTLPLQRQEGS